MILHVRNGKFAGPANVATTNAEFSINSRPTGYAERFMV
jgi:hypothetical protein